MSNMSGDTKTTTDHDEIRAWAEARGGRPVQVTNAFAAQPGEAHLRIDFLHDKYDDGIREVGWDEFFRVFDQHDMVLVYQSETEAGALSRFGRIVRREAVAQAVIE